MQNKVKNKVRQKLIRVTIPFGTKEYSHDTKSVFLAIAIVKHRATYKIGVMRMSAS